MPQPTAAAPGQAGAAQSGAAGPFNLINISFDLMTAIGTSTADDTLLRSLQGGHHDPNTRGFTLQQAEVQMTGAVDPFFQGQFVLVSAIEGATGETVVEVEEAWLTTQNLPYNLQVRAGVYLTDFGRLNPVHPHAWDFQDQPVLWSRLFGEDGMRGPGARLSWLAPTRTFLEATFGVQSPRGETQHSFLSSEESYAERSIGGRPYGGADRPTRSWQDYVYHARLATSIDPSAATTLGAGLSGVFGPNATGPEASTTILGADVMWRWRPLDNRRGYPFFKVQAEVAWRRFGASAQVDTSDPGAPVALPAQTLHDYGGYVYAAWGFDVAWSLGLRAEYATGDGGSYLGGGAFGRDGDLFRADRVRLSPMLGYQTSEFSRLRLQYNYDRGSGLGGAQHSVWLGFEILIGPHQPHTY